MPSSGTLLLGLQVSGSAAGVAGQATGQFGLTSNREIVLVGFAGSGRGSPSGALGVVLSLLEQDSAERISGGAVHGGMTFGQGLALGPDFVSSFEGEGGIDVFFGAHFSVPLPVEAHVIVGGTRATSIPIDEFCGAAFGLSPVP